MNAHSCKPSYLDNLFCLSIMLAAPLTVFSILYMGASSASSCSLMNLCYSFLVVTLFLALQAILHIYLPGKTVLGCITPSGARLIYKLNSILCLQHNYIFFILWLILDKKLALNGTAFIHDNWINIYIICCLYGLLLSFWAYLRKKESAENSTITQSFLYDFYMGIELNPRLPLVIGKYIDDKNVVQPVYFDVKFFFNAHTGIQAWSLIVLCFIIKRFLLFGSFSVNMIALFILQVVYILDFFSREEWYLNTIDINHERFGFMLAWGDLAWLPFIYTTQALSLVDNPHSATIYNLMLIQLLGLFGYFIFRVSNNQKFLFQQSQGACRIWGKPVRYISTVYSTSSNSVTGAKLLTSGFWVKLHSIQF
jgi:7-dehydrocholesterol reductase